MVPHVGFHRRGSARRHRGCGRAAVESEHGDDQYRCGSGDHQWHADHARRLGGAVVAVSLFPTPPPVNSPDNAENTYSMATRIEFLVAGTIVGVRFWGATNNISTSPVA